SEDIEQLATKLVFMKNGEIILEEKKDNLFNHYGILEHSKEEVKISNDILIASRVRKGSRISLINDRTAITDARPLETIDDAIKLIMRGDS
ncbi:ABC transporter ATP-binding protein, partial [Mammaliicoccus sciuri]